MNYVTQKSRKAQIFYWVALRAQNLNENLINKKLEK